MQFYLIFVLNCITEIDENYASFCLVNMSTVPNFLDFTINAVLHTTFIRKLCYKLSSIVTFTFIQIFLIKIVPSSLNGIRVAAFAWYSVKIHVVFGVRSERWNVNKKQTYMETETCKLYSGVFWIFLPNFIKIDPNNFELYRFKFGAFFETQCRTRINYPCETFKHTLKENILIVKNMSALGLQLPEKKHFALPHSDRNSALLTLSESKAWIDYSCGPIKHTLS